VRPPIFTLGHSTRPIDEFTHLLQAHGITQLVDIRTVPRSRHNPQYEQDTLRSSLADAGISYVYLKTLGGLRPRQQTPVNAGWRNQSFRNYADYMQTEEFRDGINELLEVSVRGPTAIMCAEAVPWRCHRSLVGDALLARGVTVLDIVGAGEPKPHVMTKFAVINGTDINYPATEDDSPTRPPKGQ
jgi:uncharacterized protein (DUF488 family)